MTLPTRLELDLMDMQPLMDGMQPCPEISFMDELAGVNHYRLLRWFGAVYSGAVIYEIGTYMGLSTVCLAENSRNKVITYDTTFEYVKWINQPANVERRYALPDTFPVSISEAVIVFVDTFHDGKLEREIYDYLIAKHWHGILIFDDIYYNDAMREFWNSLPNHKIDATNIGHVTGTGIIEL